MDVLKSTTQELRAIDAKELRTAEQDLRKQLVELRMDVYTSAATNVGTIRKLRKTLARIKTVQTEKARAAKG